MLKVKGKFAYEVLMSHLAILDVLHKKMQRRLAGFIQVILVMWMKRVIYSSLIEGQI
ncbi:hypothetical protein D9M71_808280 [compost metagenome]